MRIWPVIFFTLLFGIPVFSQTGPAGVGTSNTNVFWIKADKGTSSITPNTPISFWNDQSGNAIHVSQSTAAQQPSFAVNVLNGNPGIHFDNNNTAGQNDLLLAADNPKLDNTPGYSFFTVSKMNFLSGDARCIVSKRTAIDIDEAFMFFYYTGNSFFMDIDGIGNRQSTSPVTYTTGIGYIMDGFYDGTLASANRSKLYEEEVLRKTFTETSALVPDKPSPLNIGCTHNADSRPFGGYISEVIIYTVTVNDAQRVIVNNYLSSKYSIALTANDKYAGDLPANGDYDKEVAGIGMESSGSNPTFSASVSGGITIANTAGLDVGDYILAGYASAANAQILYDVGGMTGINNARWARIWYMDITNTATALTNTIEFDMSDGGVGTVPIAVANNYVLLYRAGQTGNWTELATASSISGDQVIFSGVTLSDDGYYTIGTQDYLVSPLPVELTRFDAVMNGDAVDVSWTTASEKDNAFFTVEKSRDGISFETLATREGAGNSTSVTNYYEKDLKPFDGISYYRLKQQDRNGQFSYSAIVSVDRSQQMDAGILVYPNPSDGTTHISMKGFETQAIELTVTDAIGRLCISRELTVQEAEETIQMHREETLAPGSYVLTISTKNAVYRRKIAVR